MLTTPSRQARAAAIIAALGTMACATSPRQTAPGDPVAAPPPAATQRAPGVAVDTVGRRHTAADVEFMRHMIHHHAQALDMTRLVPSRSERQDIRLLAERIEVSQQDEIAQMQRWLRDRGEAVPGVGLHGGHHHADPAHAAMPGMASAEELARLASARGAAFDRLFLDLMIRHHAGALTMVETLFATPGAAQDPQLFQLASDVDTDQRMEIERMRRVQAALPAPEAPAPASP